MKVHSPNVDNLAELLNTILEFTEIRSRVLKRNLEQYADPDYCPADLDAAQFADLMDQALEEHLLNNRLLLQDTPTIKFSANGRFMVKAITDHKAARLRRKDLEKYMALQHSKLRENQLNRKVARQLLCQKQKVHSNTQRYL